MNCDGFSSRDLAAITDSFEKNESCLRRFVILWHSIPSGSKGSATLQRASHFDMMFEDSEHLVTFEIPKLPIPGDRVPIRRLADHRLHYLTYEGPLGPGVEGEDRGHVTRWTEGNYRFYRWTSQKLIVELSSAKLSARIVLLPGNIEKGRIDTQSVVWPASLTWELRAPRWDLQQTKKRMVND